MGKVKLCSNDNTDLKKKKTNTIYETQEFIKECKW